MMIIQGYNFFFLQISFLGHIIILDKYILSTLFTVPRQDSVCVCVCVCLCVRNGRMLVFSIQLKFNTCLFLADILILGERVRVYNTNILFKKQRYFSLFQHGFGAADSSHKGTWDTLFSCSVLKSQCKNPLPVYLYLFFAKYMFLMLANWSAS